MITELSPGVVHPANAHSRMKVAKFINYQHDDYTWFKVENTKLGGVRIEVVRAGQLNTEKLILDRQEAFALQKLITQLLKGAP